MFDLAVNGETVISNLDIGSEAGRARAHGLKKVVRAKSKDGRLEISFPRIASYQAVISAIAISTADMETRPPTMPGPLVADLRIADVANAGADALSPTACANWRQSGSQGDLSRNT